MKIKMIVVVLVLGTLFCGKLSANNEVTVSVFDNQGKPLANVPVVINMEQTPIKAPEAIASMDQVNRQFSPHILVVQKGANISFPNSDSIKHHVFSFSPAKRFELLLNKGLEEDPLLFDKSGIVELGCNVHDWMLGYIYVVDTPYFGKTNQHGLVKLEIPEGNGEVSIWHPRIVENEGRLVQSFSQNVPNQVEFSLLSDLLPDLEQYESEADEFSEYD